MKQYLLDHLNPLQAAGYRANEREIAAVDVGLEKAERLITRLKRRRKRLAETRDGYRQTAFDQALAKSQRITLKKMELTDG